MAFIKLTNVDGSPITINTEHVVFAELNGSRAKIHLSTGGHIRVEQAYEEVDALLPKETVLTSVELTHDGTLPTIDLQPTPEQIAEGEARRQAEEQAALEAEAETARKNNKGNPAKDRETK